MKPKKVKQQSMIHQPDVRAKIIGVLLMIIGLLLLLNPTSLSIKLAFALILIGILMIVLITEQSVPRKISSAQVEGNLAFVNRMIKELKLKGNAVFLPKSRLLTEERVFIPVQTTTDATIPSFDDDVVISKGIFGENQGLSVPPSGLTLLKKIETEASFDHIGIENVEEKLQTFVGMNILKSVTLKKEPNGWKLELVRPEPCSVNEPTCTQYPCATCSAVLTAITKASDEKIWIQETARVGSKTIYHLKIGD
jgi:hypothetical protein